MTGIDVRASILRKQRKFKNRLCRVRKGEDSSGFIEVPVWVRDHDFLKVPPGQGCVCVLMSESYF